MCLGNFLGNCEIRIGVIPIKIGISSVNSMVVWYRTFRFYKRAATEVFNLVNRHTNSATDGTLGMQGEHLVLAAFARRQFLLIAEEASGYRGVEWTTTGHDLDFVFEKDGRGYGIEVKNTLGYMDVDEFVTKIRLARHIGAGGRPPTPWMWDAGSSVPGQ